MLARRVCRRGPLPRRVEEICGRGPELASGEESTSERQESLKGERASAGRGCFERGTLNASTVENPFWSYRQFALLGGGGDVGNS